MFEKSRFLGCKSRSTLIFFQPHAAPSPTPNLTLPIATKTPASQPVPPRSATTKRAYGARLRQWCGHETGRSALCEHREPRPSLLEPLMRDVRNGHPLTVPQPRDQRSERIDD